MRNEYDDFALLYDMLDSARAVKDMMVGITLENYTNDRRTRRAVEREIEIIGEAARKVSDSFKANHPEIPWRRIIGQRHKLAHEYGEIQHEILYQVAIKHIPELIFLLEPLIPPLPLDE